jgi:hypothetical protein
MPNYQETFHCKKCGGYTYVLAKVGYRLVGDVLPQFEDRYEKKLCPTCYKEEKK